MVTHKLPYNALLTAEECYDPTLCTDKDDTVTEIEDGIEVKLLRDWSRPPIESRCICQVNGKICTCEKGAKPEGYSMQLTWDKVNSVNRYILIYWALFKSKSISGKCLWSKVTLICCLDWNVAGRLLNILYAFYIYIICIRDRYLSHHFPKGPKNRKNDLNPDWFKGNTPFFLTQNGTPFGRVEFDEFSKFIGTKVTHKDLRKIYTTDIKYNKSQVYKFICKYTSSTSMFFRL